MYKVARDSSRPPARPGAESVAGADATRPPPVYAQEEIQFDPTDDDMQTNADEDRGGEAGEGPVVVMNDAQQACPVQAQLVEDEGDIEERIVDRLIKGATVADVVEPDDSSPKSGMEDVQPTKSRKTLWIILGVAAVLLIALAVGLGVGLSGKDGSNPAPAPTPAPTLRADNCLTTDDGSIICYTEDVPAPGLLTLFFECPTTDEASVADCRSCAVVEADNVFDFDATTSPVCHGCMICGKSNMVAYDCTNLAPGEECSFRDCSGECGKGDPPVTNENTQADDCFSSDGFFCNKEGTPTTSFVTQFQDCPNASGLNVFECNKCVVVNEDLSSEVDSTDETCNGCLVCGTSIAFDCSNVAPDDSCSVTTCDGTCVG